CLRVEWPSGHDANDYACVSADVTGALGKVLRGASWMGKGTAPKRRRQPSTAKPAAGASEGPELTADVPASTEPDVDEPDVDGEAPASAVAVEPDAVLDDDGMRVTYGERRWRGRGVERNTRFDVLRVEGRRAVPAGEWRGGVQIP